MSSFKSHFFGVNLKGAGGGRGILSAYPRPDITGGPPPEFAGRADDWSPEHLLAGAAALCFLTTLAAFAKKSRIDITSFQCETEGKVQAGPDGLRFESLVLRVTLGISAEASRGHQLVELAKSRCLIAQSLRFPVEVLATVNGEALREPAGAASAPAAEEKAL